MTTTIPGRSARAVQPGDVYRWTYTVQCRSGEVIPEGYLMKVWDSTTKTPHGEISESGVNWLCETPRGITCWATLEHCIRRGLLVLEK